MTPKFLILSFAICVALALATSNSRQFVMLHRSNPCFSSHTCHAKLGYDWTQQGRSPAGDEVRLVLAVKQKNLDKLDALFHEVSNPDSPNYGKYLSLEQMRDLTIDPHATSTLVHWLLDEGVTNFESTGDFITIHVNVSTAERLFNTEFYRFSSQIIGTTIDRTHATMMPSDVVALVDFVGHTTHFPPTRPRPMRRHKNATRHSGNTDINLINKFYNVDSNKVNNKQATQSLYESLDQSFSPDDLSQFLSQYNLPDAKMTKVIGPNDPSQCTTNPDNCGEANLDVQYIMAVAQGAPTTYWSTDPNSNFVDWIVAVAKDANPPLVHSVSYGEVENGDDNSMLDRFNTEVQKLGARGITVVVASGDDGVANFPARNNATACGFYPSFPATSPYVTAVGATQGPEAGSAEVGCASSTGGLITTGGGFSYHFAQPSYQSAAVQQFLNTAGSQLPPTPMFNNQGRGYPDVAVLGHNYAVIIGGQVEIVSGTSASAPVFAGFLTLVNSARLSAGKPALGFVNPLLYKIAAAGSYNDITSGTNNCAAGQDSPVCCQYGFSAQQGWDPVSGLGSVNFPVFFKQLVAA